MGTNMDYRGYGDTPAWPNPATPAASTSTSRRRRKLPWLLAAAVVIVGLVATGVVLLINQDSRFAFGTVSIEAGTVELQSEPDGAFSEIAGGDSVRTGDTLRIGDGGLASVTLADGSLLRLGEGSLVAFEEPAADDWLVRLIEGTTWYRHTPDSSGLTVDVAIKAAAIHGKTGVAAVDCAASGSCTVQAISGTIDLVPTSGAELALAPSEQATFDNDGALTDVRAVDPTENPSWVTENEEADAAAGLDELPAPTDRPGVLAEAHVDGTWAFGLAITESTADNFAVGDAPVFDMDLTSSCAQGPCDFDVTFGRYTGSGQQADDGTIAFTVAAPLQCVNTGTGAVTVPDNGPESLTFDLRASEAEFRGEDLVVTALIGLGRYEKDVLGPCRPGDQVGPAFAVMDVTGTLS